MKTAISDIDIYRCANEVIKTHPDPMVHAAARYDELLDRGDIDGCLVWKRISAAIEELLAKESVRSLH